MRVRNTLLLLFSLFVVNAFAGGTPPAYSIKVKVKGIKDTTCLLAYHFGDKQYLKDTAKVDSKGNFTFEGTTPLEGGIYLVVLPDKRYFEVLINEQKFAMETDTADYVKNMKVTGSTENTLFYEYLKYLNPKGEEMNKLQKSLADAKSKKDSTDIKDKMKAVSKEINDYRLSVINNNPKTFVAKLFKAMMPVEVSPADEAAAKAKGDSLFTYRFYKDHYFDNIDFSDDRITKTPVYHEKLKEYFEHLVYPNVDSINAAADNLVKKSEANKEVFKYTVWYITTKHETSQLMGADAVFVHMVNKYYKTGKAYWVDKETLAKIVQRAQILEPLLLGKKAPDLMLKDSTGTYRRLRDQKSKYTFVYFWDPNCGHCQKTTPKLYEVYLKYKDKGLSVYAVNIDRKHKDWVNFIHKNDLAWTNVYDPDHTISFRDRYDIYATPVLYILNDKQEIIAKRVSYEQADEIIANSIKHDKEKKK
ncbi:TlpA family protein disulfide reductase [Sporocytophaga myxococcoides]|uniref:TlpA family protein disulfide reductase n=1 Tax=Sporocytophaga myxococcoides TaxID=153721 RepID=UPI0005EF9269|nr:TlpA family protein disulfide reductase [Sporocytophaga myxococcoides]